MQGQISAVTQMYQLLFCLTSSQQKETGKKKITVRGCVWHVFAHVCVCVWTCACVLDREGSWAFASTAVVVVWTAMYLTSYSDYLIGLLGLS